MRLSPLNEGKVENIEKSFCCIDVSYEYFHPEIKIDALYVDPAQEIL